ncbi:MAG TPA: glycosyltransferase, partial [Candidatus Marinimicrobia bacterium]|nr:glycosyltransferase [Candidatus Neomarinimicrobiota bacterium]HRS90876.1 glycosyltransferase [Candidatus Neomarinimicrobiota bacterium]
MKLFIVPSWYPSRLNPKSGIFFYEHIRILQDAGDDVVVIVSLTHSFKKIFTPNKLLKIRSGIFTEFGQTTTYRHEALNWFPKRPQKTYRYQQRQIIQLFDQAIADQGRPEMVIAHSSLFAGAALSRWLQEQGIPLVIFEHLMHFLKPELLTGFYKDCIREAYRYADRIVAISSKLRDSIVEQFPESASKITVIPNPVDISAFSLASEGKKA